MIRKTLSIVFGAVLALALMIVAPNSRADEVNQATQMTFNQPFQIPDNTVLPAGTYWFVVPAPTELAPDVVQIFNADRTKVLASLLTIPDTRLEATGRTEVTFAERPNNQPVALINWFYPGRLAGHEFIYSPSEEAKLSESEHITTTLRNAPLEQAG